MRRILLAAAVVVVSVAFVACSSSSKSGTPSSSTRTTVSTAISSSTTTGDAEAAPALTSVAFADGAPIPRKYGCEAQGGANASPPLIWSGFPRAGATLVLVVHDPDAPIPGGFTHLVTTMTPGTVSVGDGANTSGGPMKDWQGPCPPSGTHHYVFTLYTFGPGVSLPAHLDKAAVDAIAAKAVASATLTGTFTSSV